MGKRPKTTLALHILHTLFKSENRQRVIDTKTKTETIS